MVNMTKPDLPAHAVREIAAACKKAEEALEHRDEVLRRWASDGFALRVLAEASGRGKNGKVRISHSGISRVVDRGQS